MYCKHELPALEVDLIGFPTEFADENCEMPHSDATIDFAIDIDAREWGVKSINVWTNKISLYINDKEFVVIDVDDGWVIRDEQEWDFASSICPNRLEIDYEQKEAWVYYG